MVFKWQDGTPLNFTLFGGNSPKPDSYIQRTKVLQRAAFNGSSGKWVSFEEPFVGIHGGDLRICSKG